MLSIFKKHECEIDPSDIVKEGFLSKESRLRKVWRQYKKIKHLTNKN